MTARRIYLLILFPICWFALIGQCLLHLQNSPVSPVEAWLRFLTYFTILTNLVVAIYISMLLARSAKGAAGFWHRPSVQTAIVMYITLVGIVYNTILRQIWAFTGLQWLVNELLHTLIPLMVIIYWVRWVDARTVKYRSIPGWLIYPAIYTAVIMARGPSAGWYPYPFMDIDVLGTRQVLINSFFVLLGFVVLSLIYVFIGQRKKTPALV